MLRNVTKNTAAQTACRLAVLAILAASAAAPADHARKAAAAEPTASGNAVLWTDPQDLASRDLFYGPGGKQHEPRGPFTFLKEDLGGTNPKFDVRDAAGVKWKVKLGLEARPETTATRIVWAAGYYVTEDYFVRDMRIEGLPERVHRGRKMIGEGGAVHNVRLKREPEGEKKIGTWQWENSKFTGTREWNGLRALMAVINNWDLKDENNAIYRSGDRQIYLVSDLGASFGSAGRSWPAYRAKDNLESYTRSKFIRKLTSQFVDFATPARPRWVYAVNPKEYFGRIHLERIGKDVPRADAKWLGQLLARLSPAQIHDAFRAGGYSPREIDAFSQILQQRISALTDL